MIILTNTKYSCTPVRLMLYSELGYPVSVLSHVSALTVTPYSGLMVLFTVISYCLSLPDSVYTALPSMTTEFRDDGQSQVGGVTGGWSHRQHILRHRASTTDEWFTPLHSHHTTIIITHIRLRDSGREDLRCWGIVCMYTKQNKYIIT